MNRKALIALCAAALGAQAVPCRADGVVIDTIYHPYVQPLEQELEWRSTLQNTQPGVAEGLQVHRLAYGRSLNDRWFLEFYVLGARSDADSLDLEGYELEAKWQLTEQGEYWADWGLLFEVEKEAGEDAWEFAAGVLGEKEWGKWSGTVNAFLINEQGRAIEDEWETQLNLQARYRYSRAFEPAIEYYSGEYTRGLGPAALGQVAVGPGRRLNWEAGLIFGLDSESPDRTLRFSLDFEF